jgi:hypothetical protein
MELPRRRGNASSKTTGEKEKGREREIFVKARSGYDLRKYRQRFIDLASKLSPAKVVLLIAVFLVLVYVQLMTKGDLIEPDVSPVDHTSPMDYTHEGYALQGFLALPESGSGHKHTKFPAIIIVP